MLNENFVIVGSIITLAGGLSYFFDTVKGKVQPNRVSWLLWALAPLIAFAAEIQQGVGIQSLLTFSFGLIPAIVFIGSFLNKKSYWKIEAFDIFCGALSLLGLLLWYFTKVGNIAILFSIFADASASFPTLVKAYKEPETENDHVFFANAVSAIITLFTITAWNFQTYGFPIYMLVMMGSIALLIRFKIGKRLRKIK